MKIDTARAWKDENYRQSLSNEQVNALPANPAGELELSSSELETINGGGGFENGFGFNGLGASGSSTSTSSHQSSHSLAVRCNETAFSLTMVHGFSLLSPVNAFCLPENDNRDDNGIDG